MNDIGIGRNRIERLEAALKEIVNDIPWAEQIATQALLQDEDVRASSASAGRISDSTDGGIELFSRFKSCLVSGENLICGPALARSFVSSTKKAALSLSATEPPYWAIKQVLNQAASPATASPPARSAPATRAICRTVSVGISPR